MNHISVKGVARQYGRKTGSFLVRLHLIQKQKVESLRTDLEHMARSERAVEVLNCPDVEPSLLKTFAGSAIGRLIGMLVGGPLLAPLLTIIGGTVGFFNGHLVKWDAEFQQTWTHILVRIKVFWLAESNDPNQQAQLLQLWKEAIEGCWSNRWSCRRDGEIACPITFEVQWLDPLDQADAHQALIVTDDIERAAFFWWDDRHGAWPAVHEFGHIIGLTDEYVEEKPPDSYPCPGRDDPSDPIIHHDSLMAIGTDPSWVLVSVLIGTDSLGNQHWGTALTLEDATTNWRHHLNSNVNALLPGRYFAHFSDFISSNLVRA